MIVNWIKKAIIPNINRKGLEKLIIELNIISQIALFMIMMLTASEVILRYLFNSPIVFAQEATELLLVVCVSLGLSYCAIENGHVRVDALTSKLTLRMRAIFECFTSLITLVFFILIVWRSFVQMSYLAEKRLTSMILFLPIYPFLGVIGIGFSIFCIVLLLDLTNSISKVFKK